jgi:predicted HTH transcriptional regulator
LKENIALRDQQSAEKDKQIAGEKAARETTEKQLTIETKEKEKAQRSAKFWRKVGTVAGAAAGFLIFGAMH